jgi:hypothetical protein
VVGVEAGFGRTLDAVERARASLVTAAPGRRGLRRPLAEALAGFESELAEARSSIGTWRVPTMEREWVACGAALDEAGRRAEHLRLEASPQGYEDLAPLLAELLDPLDAFDEALRTFRGRRG